MDMIYLLLAIHLIFNVALIVYYKPIAEWIEQFISRKRSEWFVKLLSYISALYCYCGMFVSTIFFLIILGLGLTYISNALGLISLDSKRFMSDVHSLTITDARTLILNLLHMMLAVVTFIIYFSVIHKRKRIYMREFNCSKFSGIRFSSLFYFFFALSGLVFFFFLNQVAIWTCSKTLIATLNPSNILSILNIQVSGIDMVNINAILTLVLSCQHLAYLRNKEE